MTYTRKILVLFVALFVFIWLPTLSYGQPVIKLTASDRANGDWFGTSAWLSGDDLVIGARFTAGVGSAYIFTRDGGTWIEQAKLTASDAGAGDEFGNAAALDGDYAVIGAYLSAAHGPDAGQAYVFKRNGTVWHEEARLAASDIAGGDQFGASVAIQGAYIVVGSRNHGGAGAVYVFKRNGAVWEQQAKLAAASAVNGDEFGGAVSIDGNDIIVGALERFTGGTGSAYVFKRNGTAWNEQARLTPSDATSSIQFGRAVSISGDYAVAGTRFSSTAYVFKRNGTAWNEQVKLIPSGGSTSGIFGFSVFLRGDRLVVGDPHEFENGTRSGKAYVYDRSGAVWEETAILVPPNPTPSGEFGYALSIDEEVVLVSALTTDQEKGAAFVFQMAPPNQPPVADAGGPYSGAEGAAIPLSGTASDPDSDPLTLSWSIDTSPTSATCTFSDASALNPDLNCDDNGTFTVTLTADDGTATPVSDDGTVTVSNVAPSVGAVTVPTDPIDINDQPVTDVSAPYTDPGTNDTHTCMVDYDDGTVPQVGTTAGGTCTDPAGYTYIEAGVYEVTVEVTDDDDGMGSATATTFIVIYDPDGGFVTGGGWINSPANACEDFCGGATGKANFGFVSKYKKGATIPTGQTEFQFKAGNLNFHSLSYDWLVIAGAKAMYKGIGTINQSGTYGFMLTAIDEKLTPSTEVDLFRIKIWDKDADDALVYDNQVECGEGSEGDDQDPCTAIGGGNIVIHSGKGNNRVAEDGGTEVAAMEEVPKVFALYGSYPNPFNPQTTVRFDVPEASQVRLVVFDVLGRQVRVLVDGKLSAGKHSAVFEAGGLPSGTYLVRLVTPTGSFVQTMQLVK